MKSLVHLFVPASCLLLAASTLTGASAAAPSDKSAEAASATRDVHRYAPPRHELLRPDARGRWKYRYASGGQRYRKGRRPKGLSARFTVHKPREVKWRRGDHSLAEIALTRPGSRPKRPTYIEAGWVRGNGRSKTRLFVFWWGLKGKPHCYNMKCKGFVRKGKGKRPGAVLKPGTKIRIGWVHKHNRWNLYVNGKRSGYYPDRLWKNKFQSIAYAQIFGEVAHGGGRGRCADMGNGKRPKRRRAARVWDITLHRTKKKTNIRQGHESRNYKFNRTSRRSFRYGGRGPC